MQNNFKMFNSSKNILRQMDTNDIIKREPISNCGLQQSVDKAQKFDADALCEKMEKQLTAFAKDREILEEEMTKIREQLKLMIDSLFDHIIKELTPIMQETDAILDDGVQEFRKLINRKKEIDNLLGRLTPVIELLKTNNQDRTGEHKYII